MVRTATDGARVISWRTSSQMSDRSNSAAADVAELAPSPGGQSSGATHTDHEQKAAVRSKARLRALRAERWPAFEGHQLNLGDEQTSWPKFSCSSPRDPRRRTATTRSAWERMNCGP
jgi:hypothetical protein